MKWRNQRLVEGRIAKTLKPIMEEWIGGNIPLQYNNVYGPRRYRHGAQLWLHVDRMTTHIISAILQLDQVYQKYRNFTAI